jgi:molybdopterin converting factor small subunit
MGQKNYEIKLENTLTFEKFVKEFALKYNSFNTIIDFFLDKDKKQPVFIVYNGEIVKNPYKLTLEQEDEIAFLPPVGGG